MMRGVVNELGMWMDGTTSRLRLWWSRGVGRDGIPVWNDSRLTHTRPSSAGMRHKRHSPAPLVPAKRPATDDQHFSWTLDPVNHVYVGRYGGGGEANGRIAAFDFDGTLSVPKSGKTFPRDAGDFRLLDSRLPDRVKEITDGRRFVIFTNQMGVGKHTTADDVRDRIHGLLKLLGSTPCIVFASILENDCRKPRTGMFQLFCQAYNDQMEIDKAQSVYVGDAAGRKKSANRPKDHSDADYLFALNCGLNFMTPEQLLAATPIEKSQQENEQTLPRPSYHPKQWLSQDLPFGWDESQGSKEVDEDSFTRKWDEIRESKRVVVVLIGVPGSGKSHFVQRFCPNWSVISRDAIGTMAKCEQALSLALKDEECRVVIDNTNFDLESRKRWLSIASKSNCMTIAVCMVVSVEQALHNNCFRRLAALRRGLASAQMVPTFVIKNQVKNFVPPTPDEGFALIFRLNFIPSFDDQSLRNLYACYL